MADIIRKVQFLRNGSLFATREAARAALEEKKDLGLDGGVILARYSGETVSDVKTLAGFIYTDGTTANTTVTIFDIDDAGADVDEKINDLRNEIEKELGSGVTSANTATAQLAALSGDPSTSTSAETSVEGAKRYADELIDELDYNDTAVAKKFVVAVDETNGKIAVERGSIASSAGTILLTDTDDGGVNFEVHIDGVSILKNASGELSVANSALISYEGDEDTVHVSEASQGVRTVSSLLTIQKVNTGLSADVKEEYRLVGASGNTIGDPVKIYKDSHIVSINYISASTDPHYQSLEYVYVNDSGATSTTYVDMSELVLEAEFASGVTVTDHVVRGVVDPNSETFLAVGADGFKLSGIQDAIDNAVSGVDTDVKALSGKTITAITSNNNSISTSITDNVGNKTVNIETDASKISGLTAVDNVPGEISGVSATDSVQTGIKNLYDSLAAEIAARKAAISSTTVNGSDAIDVTQSSSGDTVSLKLDGTSSGTGHEKTGTDNALTINSNGLFLSTNWDCGTF